MSKLPEWTLNIILLVLLFAGAIFAGELVRAHPLLPVSLLLLIGLVSFLLFWAPDYLGDRHLPTALRYCFYASLVAALMCMAYYSKGKVSAERLFYGGKIKHTEVEIDTEQGPGSDPVYYLEQVPNSIDNLVGLSFFVLMVGVPYLAYRLWQKAAPGTG